MRGCQINPQTAGIKYACSASLVSIDERFVHRPQSEIDMKQALASDSLIRLMTTRDVNSRDVRYTLRYVSSAL
jgi:hypothetical protein